jgi:hypothetical protein
MGNSIRLNKYRKHGTSARASFLACILHIQQFYFLTLDTAYRARRLTRFIFLYLISPDIECSRIPAKDIKIPIKVIKNTQITDLKSKSPPGIEASARLRLI